MRAQDLQFVAHRQRRRAILVALVDQVLESTGVRVGLTNCFTPKVPPEPSTQGGAEYRRGF